MSKNQPKLRKQSRASPSPTLRFTPTAWAKLLFLRDLGDTEVGGFGIASSEDLLLVEDVRLVRQTCTWAHVAFADESVADFFDVQVDEGRKPEQFARIWAHTHPGDCPQPSLTDEATFARVFGSAQWALMFILARGGQSYARLRFNVGPPTEIELAVDIDYTRPFDGCDVEGWEQEYQDNVEPQTQTRQPPLALDERHASRLHELPPDEWYADWWAYAEGENNIEEAAYE